MVKLLEADDYILYAVISLFLLINFDLTVGIIYFGIAIAGWLAYYVAFDKQVFKLIPFERFAKDRWMSLIIAMGAYVVFIYGAGFITQQLAVFDIEHISSLIASTFSTSPILFGSTPLRIFTWGLLIPIIETRFFFRTLLQWGLNVAGIKQLPSPFSGKGIMTAVFFGAIFTIFHIVAKGITANDRLLVTFIFGVISILLVLYYKELSQALFLHIITNTIATMQIEGIFLYTMEGVVITGIITLAVVIFTSYMLLFHQIPFISKPRVRL